MKNKPAIGSMQTTNGKTVVGKNTPENQALLGKKAPSILANRSEDARESLPAAPEAESGASEIVDKVAADAAADSASTTDAAATSAAEAATASTTSTGAAASGAASAASTTHRPRTSRHTSRLTHVWAQAAACQSANHRELNRSFRP